MTLSIDDGPRATVVLDPPPSPPVPVGYLATVDAPVKTGPTVDAPVKTEPTVDAPAKTNQAVDTPTRTATEASAKTPLWLTLLRAPAWPALALLLIYAAYPQPFTGPDVDPHVTPAAWVALAVTAVGLWSTKLWRNPATLLLLAFWAAFTYTLPISTAWTSIHPDATAETHLMHRGFILAVAITFAFAHNAHRIAPWWVAVAVLIVPLGAYEVLTTHHFRPADAPWDGPPRSPMGLFYNPNFYAGMLLTGCFASVVALMQRPPRAVAWLLRLIIVVSVPLLWFTYSRAALAALIIGTVTAGVVYLVLQGNITRWRTLAAAVLLAATGVGVASTQVSVLRDNNPLVQLVAPSDATRNSDHARLDWTLAGLDYLREQPLTGIGAGAFERAYSPRAAAYGYPAVSMHNALVQLLCQYGLMLAALWVPLLLFLPLQALRVLRRRRELPVAAPTWAFAQLLFLTAFLLLSQLVGKALIVMPWWLLLGTMCAISHHLSSYLRAATGAANCESSPARTVRPAFDR